MKTLLKLSTILMLTLLSTSLWAQKVGVRAGLNFSNIMMNKEEMFGLDNKYKPSFNLGFMAEVPFSEMISIETGVIVNGKGFAVNQKDEDYSYKANMNLWYADIPLTAKANFDVSGIKVHGIFGPYVGVGILGNTKGSVTYNGETEKSNDKIKFGNDAENDDVKRLDYGVLLGAGATYNGMEFRLTYGLGLAKINPEPDATKFNNSVISLSVGYFLGK